MSISMPYGNENIQAELSAARPLGSLDIADAPALIDPEGAVRDALSHPIGLNASVAQSARPNELVAILVSDSFRQTRADIVLPILIHELTCGGINAADIRLVFSTGTHRGPTPDEQRAILGPEIFDQFSKQVIVHDAHCEADMVYIGDTSRGTRVEINRHVHEADRVIVTGSVVLHYFGGFGGGRKSVVPGVASAKTIAHNHAMNLHPTDDELDPNVRIGALQGNPVAEDMLEATQLTRVDCIVNTVLNRDGDIAGVFAGELEQAHAAACSFARQLFEVPIAEQADLVIAASPNTKNFVQTHKALFNAYQAMKPGGRIVLLAPCPEGLGGDQFTQWLSLGDRADIIAALRKRSEINGQTALSTREKAPAAIMVTQRSQSDVELLGAHKADSLQEALDAAVRDLKAVGTANPTYYLMPSSAYTVPTLTE